MFFFKQAKKAAERESPLPRKDLGEGLYYTYKQTSNGIGGYADRDICLYKERKAGFACCLVDEEGIIQNFPGFDKGDWIKLAEYPIENKVRFGFSIAPFSQGKAKVTWMFQPDGWYYADSQGYGKEKDEEVVLYSYINKKGKFLVPFGPK